MKIEETSHAASDKFFFEHKDTKTQNLNRFRQISRSKYREAIIAEGKYREAIIAEGINITYTQNLIEP